jgi:hypothetical protein
MELGCADCERMFGLLSALRFGFQELAVLYAYIHAVGTVLKTWFNIIGLYAALSCERAYIPLAVVSTERQKGTFETL